MKEIINQLSEIEKAASDIVFEATKKKESIFKEVEEKKKTLDFELEQEVKEKANILNKSLHEKMENDMIDLRSNTNESIEMIQEIYNTKHNDIAKDIMNRIIGV